MRNFEKVFSESNNSTYIISEIGVNHNGDLGLAKKMIDQSIECGADAVKFQAFIAENIVLKNAEKANYHKVNTPKDETHFEMLKKLELDKNGHLNLKNYCDENNIDFFSTPYDIESVEMLESISVSHYKTASADLVDLTLHERIAKTKKPVIISVGMATVDEISETIDLYKRYNSDNIALLHCVSNYPCSLESLNMKVIKSLRETFNIPVGFSDHSEGYQASISAVSLGSKIIEKHFTSDKSLIGPDHKASSDPKEFYTLVDSIRKTEKILGSEDKKIQKEELDNRKISRKSITLSQSISKNTLITRDMLTMKRPGIGLKANMIEKILGKRTLKDLQKNHQISLDDID